MARMHRPQWCGTSVPYCSVSPKVRTVYYSYAIYLDSEKARELLIFDARNGMYPIDHKEEDIWSAEKSYPGSAIGLEKWLNLFKPASWNDLLMVRDCYLQYANYCMGPDWGKLSFENNKLLDPFLRSTRGIIMWQHQFDALAREAVKNAGGSIASDTINNLTIDCIEYLSGLDLKNESKLMALHVVDAPLIQILRERMWDKCSNFDADISLEKTRLADVLMRMASKQEV